MRVISRVSELIKLRDSREPKVPDLAAFLQVRKGAPLHSTIEPYSIWKMVEMPPEERPVDLAALLLQAPNIEDWANLFDGQKTSSGSLPPNIQHVVKGRVPEATPLVLVHPISGVAGNWYPSHLQYFD